MANLVLKPSTGAGNSVIVKDQAGGAVLTTADSGATLGNSTQDNITRLGTVTTGTLGSGVTFPSAHILQVQYSQTESSTTQSTNNSTKTPCGVAYKELTCLGTGSIYFAQYSCNTGSQGSGSWNGAHQWEIYQSGSWSGWTNAPSPAYWYWEDGSDRRMPKTWYSWIAPGSGLSAGEKIRIRAVCFSQHSTAVGFDGLKFETFMEVKQ